MYFSYREIDDNMRQILMCEIENISKNNRIKHVFVKVFIVYRKYIATITSFESVISRTLIECKQSIILRIFLLIYFTLIKNTFAVQCCSDPNNTITYRELSLNCVETSSQRLQISQYLHCFMNDIRQLSTRC